MSRTKRYVTMCLLHSANVLLLHVQHELWRLANRVGYAEQALTEKERIYLKRRVETCEQLSRDLTKLHSHIQKDLR